MAKSYDLKILPLFQVEKEIKSDHPGLNVALPPRRASRRRSEEKLILHLSLQGNAPLSLRGKAQLLEKLGDVFFEADGSTTSALRNVGEVLNKFLLDRNLRGSSRGIQAAGILTQVVVKPSRVIIAQSGAAHAFKITPEEVDELYDLDLSGPGLGLGRMPKIRYHQWDIESGNLILIAPEVPSSWTEAALRNLPRMKSEVIFNRLFHRIEDDLDAVLIQVDEGEGKVRVLRPLLEEEGKTVSQNEPRESEIDPAKAVKDQATPPYTASSPDQTNDPDEIFPKVSVADAREGSAAVDETGDDQQIPREEEFPGPLKPELGPELIEKAEEREPGLSAASSASPFRASLVETILSLQVWPLLGTLLRSVWNALDEVWRNIRTLATRMLPDEELLNLPPWVLGLIAVMVPLVMVTFGSFFYVNRGRDRLYQEAYQQAQTLIQEAELAASPGDRYQALSSALESIRLARSYKTSEEIAELFQQVRGEVDSLDLITRLDYKPLFMRGLGSDVSISEIVVTSWNDLYLLNENDGTVIWAQSNADGYTIKRDFTCGPASGHKEIGALVDIVAHSSAKEDQAAILGIDSSHTMIYCYTDPEEPPVLFEDTSYSLARGPVEAITLSISSPENLYILDPQKRAIWIEYQSENYHEGSEYFGAIDSPPMKDVIDLATNGSELYLLHADGYLTKCVKETPTSNPQCQTPFEFSDPREGMESGPFIAGAKFNSMFLKGSPGMALYLLDPDKMAVYRFSTQLELQKQYRPQLNSIEDKAGTFTVTMSDRIYLAVGNQVYTAQLIP